MLAESTTPFTILSDASGDVTITTDKIAYGPQENVITSCTVRNSGKNYIIPSAQAKISIMDTLGAVLFSEVKTASNLLPGASVDFNSLWNTGLNAPGEYNATLEVSFDGGVTTTKSAAFRINTVLVLNGTITASPSVVPAGDTTQLTYALTNSGNADAPGLTARITILNPETQAVMQTQDAIVDIAKNTGTSGQISVNTNGYGLKTYTAILQTLSPGVAKTLASTSLTVKDLTPPLISIITPTPNGTYKSTVGISVSATDNASGVDNVECRLDSNQWKLLPAADPALGRYSTSWEPVLADSGSHVISFRATDRAGNTSMPVSVNITIQFLTDTVPPVLTVSTLPDGSYTNSATLNIAGIVTDNVGVSGLTINDIAIPVNVDGTFSQVVGLITGSNTIMSIAKDLAGNPATDMRTVILDQAAPVITITHPSDNSVTNEITTSVTGTVDKPATVSIKINNTITIPAGVTDSTFSFPATCVYGQNTIEVTATDLAGNSGTAKRTVIFDDISPALSITNPAQDILTNQAGILLQGTVSDLTDLIVTLTYDGTESRPTVTNGRFEQQLELTTEQTCTIKATAMDAAGNMSAVQRNIIYDKTPPIVTIDPVKTPTNNRQQLVSGTVEEGAVVNVACLTAAISPVSYSTDTTWSAIIADMAEESITISATATDGPETSRTRRAQQSSRHDCPRFDHYKRSRGVDEPGCSELHLHFNRRRPHLRVQPGPGEFCSLQ